MLSLPSQCLPVSEASLCLSTERTTLMNAPCDWLTVTCKCVSPSSNCNWPYLCVCVSVRPSCVCLDLKALCVCLSVRLPACPSSRGSTMHPTRPPLTTCCSFQLELCFKRVWALVVLWWPIVCSSRSSRNQSQPSNRERTGDFPSVQILCCLFLLLLYSRRLFVICFFPCSFFFSSLKYLFTSCQFNQDFSRIGFQYL